MDKERLIEKVKARTKSNKIGCKTAMKIAEEEQVTTKQVGEILNELKIKIVSCQLGCFP
jgi:hypothetical protein